MDLRHDGPGFFLTELMKLDVRVAVLHALVLCEAAASNNGADRGGHEPGHDEAQVDQLAVCEGLRTFVRSRPILCGADLAARLRSLGLARTDGGA